MRFTSHTLRLALIALLALLAGVLFPESKQLWDDTKTWLVALIVFLVALAAYVLGFQNGRQSDASSDRLREPPTDATDVDSH